MKNSQEKQEYNIWLFSDTHNKHKELTVPDNIDIAICAGDMGTYKDPYMNLKDLNEGLEWFESLDIDTKIYSPGNHDTALDYHLLHSSQYKWLDIVIHETIEVDGIKIFCSPYTPEFFNWAYNKNDKQLKELWEDIPNNTDILVTHGPPYMILDKCQYGYRAGCKSLAKKVKEIKPKIHVFGHIHEDGGKMEKIDETYYYNAAVLDLDYYYNNNGFVIKYNKENGEIRERLRGM